MRDKPNGREAGVVDARVAGAARAPHDSAAELDGAREELERRSAYLETIVQHIPAGLVIADAATGAVTMANEQAQAILGREIGTAETVELGGEGWYRPDGSSVAAGDGPLTRALRGEHVAGEQVTLRRDGRMPITLEVSTAPVHDSAKRIVAVAALFQDVTEREARRRAAAEFITNAAHELRTPLAAIVSGVDVLEAGAKDHPAELDRFLSHIGHESGRLVRLTHALLMLARVQSGTEAARVEVVEVAPVLAEVAETIRPSARVGISVRCSAGTAALANRGLLEQALTNVADNAARYTSAGRIQLSGSRPGGLARIRIRDTGRGMTNHELRRAGERFFRGGEPESRAPGFGLGLSIARQAVEAMGGTLAIESERRVGTTVVIQLPGAKVLTG